jgi:hypothetical protein
VLLTVEDHVAGVRQRDRQGLGVSHVAGAAHDVNCVPWSNGSGGPQYFDFGLNVGAGSSDRCGEGTWIVA